MIGEILHCTRSSFFLATTVRRIRMFFSLNPSAAQGPGAATRGGKGGDVPPPSVLGGGRGGKRRRTFLGPKGPKIRKKWISTDIFANFRNSKHFESSF